MEIRRVVLHQDVCIGCEACADLCPFVFAFDATTQKAQVIKPEGGDEDCIEGAIESCPAECIEWA